MNESKDNSNPPTEQKAERERESRLKEEGKYLAFRDEDGVLYIRPGGCNGESAL